MKGLVAGLIMVGLTVGYMVGGSATPVVAIVLPLLFGLIPVGMEALKKRNDRAQQVRLLEALPSITDPGERERVLAAITRSPEAATPQGQLGVALFAISAAVLVGSVVGGVARTRQWYRPAVGMAAPLPWDSGWSKDECRLSAEAMIRFINLREDLAALGYSSTQASQLFTLTRDEWCARSGVDGKVVGAAPSGGVNHIPDPEVQPTPESGGPRKTIVGVRVPRESGGNWDPYLHLPITGLEHEADRLRESRKLKAGRADHQ